MADLTTTIPTILKYTSKICSPLLRWYYTSVKLDQFLKLDVSSSGTGVEYYLPSQEATCWLNAYNLSPFDFTIDRIEVEVVLDGGSFSCTNLKPCGPCVIKGASHQRICLHNKSPMSAESARFVKESKQARVNINAYIITSIRSFNIMRNIDDLKNYRVIA